MTRWFAGIDGGQSATIALVGDASGSIAGRGTAGPADEVGEAGSSTRLRDALSAALHAALASAGLDEDTHLEIVVAGVSGFDREERGAPAACNAGRIVVLHDAPIAHAAAFGEAAGVVAIAGTGSVIYGVDAHANAVTLGGWGYLFGDEGSAFWIAREALSATMRANDEGSCAFVAQERAFLDFFARPSLRDVQQGFARGDIGRDRIAAYAPAAIASGAFDDVVRAGAQRLAALIAIALRTCCARDVALTGGLCEIAAYRDRIAGAMQTAAPGARVRAGRIEPAMGALVLAYRYAGLHLASMHPSVP